MSSMKALIVLILVQTSVLFLSLRPFINN
ncbi:protein of unknown function [uncultured Woeseiaceae bacterium]|uniref:Uncharacterized protein n=1 Tax=uncultured Woeseiaceae bacterium TaxID=1983305 RepID=A0A7D9D3G8_9GAMM|nr:protein of unknown function [uncultured Woeseiaceae bacterium]